MDEEYHISYQEETYETTDKDEQWEENHPSLDKERMEVLFVVPHYHTIRCKGVVLGQRDSILVNGGGTHNLIDASMVSLVLIFTEVFEDPLKGLVKPHKPTNLNDAMSLTRDLQNVLPRTRFPPKHNLKFERKPWKKDAPDKKFWKKDTLEKNNK